MQFRTLFLGITSYEPFDAVIIMNKECRLRASKQMITMHFQKCRQEMSSRSIFDFSRVFSIDVSGLFFHVVGEGVVNLASKAEAVTDKENYIDFRLRLLGEPGMVVLWIIKPTTRFRNCRALSHGKFHPHQGTFYSD